jgi:anthranilate phosphoribosyltransferase
MRSFLEKILDRRSLSLEEAERLLLAIMDGEGNPVQVGGLLSALRVKGESAEEILGFARAMRKKAKKPNVSCKALMDTCGTGGDGSGSFNLSTVASFVLAGAGVPVVKHGNRAVSSQTGSADLLEALGIKATWTPEEVEEALGTVSFAFLFAPFYHPAMKAVAPIRKDLGVKTVFNLLGPLTNPCAPEYQLIGVYSYEKALILAEVLSRDQRKRVLLVHSDCGWDEAVQAGPFNLFKLEESRVSREHLDPKDLGFPRCSLADLQGGAPSQNAVMAMALLQGKPGPLRDAVVLNAGLAFFACERASSLSEGFDMAREAIDSGKALGVVEKLKEKRPCEPLA